MARSFKLPTVLLGILAVVGGIRLVQVATGWLPQTLAQQPPPPVAVRAPGEDVEVPEEVTLAGESPNPLLSRDLARSKFEVSQGNLRDLRLAKLAAARETADARMKEFLAGRGTLDFLMASSRQMLEAEQDVSTTPTERVAALERHWQRMRLIEEINRVRYDAGRIPIQDYSDCKYYRLQAEIWLIEARGKAGKAASGR